MTFTPSYAQIDSPDPINPQDLATKHYVDTHRSCRVTRIAALSTSATPSTQSTVIWDQYWGQPTPGPMGWDNSGGAYNYATGIYTAPLAGLYYVVARISLGMSAAGTLNIYIYVNGAANVVQSTYQGVGVTAFANAAVGLVSLNAGDQINANMSSSLASQPMRAPAPSEQHMIVMYMGLNL